MNERIKELADKCWEEDGIGPAYFNPEKFAELIVRECAAAAFDWYENHHNFHWDPATHVLGHFGVEE